MPPSLLRLRPTCGDYNIDAMPRGQEGLAKLRARKHHETTRLAAEAVPIARETGAQGREMSMRLQDTPPVVVSDLALSRGAGRTTTGPSYYWNTADGPMDTSNGCAFDKRTGGAR